MARSFHDKPRYDKRKGDPLRAYRNRAERRAIHVALLAKPEEL